MSIKERAAYLEQMSQLLWPAPAEVEFTSARGASLLQAGGTGAGDTSAGDTRADVTTLLVLPRLRDPRLLVPQERRAGSAALRRYGEPGSFRSRLATRALSVGLARGASGILAPDRLQVRVPPGAQTIDSHISSLLGHRVLVSMHIGGARANRKPVLQLLTPAGRTVGFAKVGHNPLTAALVRAENEALRRLGGAGLRHLRVPRILGFSRWQGLDVLILSPLPVWQRRTPLRPAQLAQAMAEVAGVSGILQSPLVHSQYWQNLTARLGKADADVACEGRARDVRAERGEVAALRAALGELAAAAGTTVLAFGSWHGDWTPWNMANTAGGLLVWDWERFTADVPVGFDALHCWLQDHVVPGRRDPARAAAECLERAPALLEPFAVAPVRAGVTALLYLADLSVRYLADRQEQAGAPLGAPGRWLLPALTTGIGTLRAAGSVTHEAG